MINAYLNTTLKIKRLNRDKWGDRQEATILTVRARVESRTRIINTETGAKAVGVHTVYFPIQQSLDVGDLIVIKDKDYAISEIEEMADFGAKFKRVVLI